MTIKELYEWAKEQGKELYEIECICRYCEDPPSSHEYVFDDQFRQLRIFHE